MTEDNRTTIDGKMSHYKADNAQSRLYHSQHELPRGQFMKDERFIDTVVGVWTISAWSAENIVEFTNGFDEEGR